MAIEVMPMRFFFHPQPDWIPTLDEQREVVEKFPFSYNAIHDIESAWWVGIWMLFFHVPKGHTESSQISRKRKDETDWLFPGTFNFARRLEMFQYRHTFSLSTEEWIPEEFLPASRVFDHVRLWILNFYRNLEKTFPDGLAKLSEKAQAHSDGHHDAFPGGPDEGIYNPIQDAFLGGKELYESCKTEIARI